MSTRELVVELCQQLNKAEYHSVCERVIIGEQWIEKVKDLQGVTKNQLVRWGLPLKLANEIGETLRQREAEAIEHGVQSLWKYELAPALTRLGVVGSAVSTMQDSLEKKRDPEKWAAKRILAAVRRWRARAAARNGRRVSISLIRPPGGESQSDKSDVSDSDEDYQVESTERALERRESRAHDRIEAAMMKYAERRRQRGEGGQQKKAMLHFWPIKKDAKIPEFDLQLVPNCEVKALLLRLAKECNRTDKQVAPHVHRLVVQHWLETIEDLDLIEEEHWDSWSIPYRLVFLINQHMEENSPGLLSSVSSYLPSFMSSGADKSTSRTPSVSHEPSTNQMDSVGFGAGVGFGLGSAYFISEADERAASSSDRPPIDRPAPSRPMRRVDLPSRTPGGPGGRAPTFHGYN